MAGYISHKNFINTYEKRIKKIREDYYRNSANNGVNIPVDLTLVAALLNAFILFISGFSIIGFIVGFILVFVINIIFKIALKMMGADKRNDYLREIRKLGYFTIEQYENSLRKYVTGHNGYYEKLLQELKRQYNLTDQVRKLEGARGELYYIWINSDQDAINLLNERTTDKPEVITIRMNNIRYFRIDYKTKTILLKTDIEQYRFLMSALDIFNEILGSKRFDNLKTFKPEEYISDFEIFIHSYIKKINTKDKGYSYNTYDLELNRVIVYSVLYVILVGLYYVFTYNWLKYILIVLIIMLTYAVSSLLSMKKMSASNEMACLKIMNSDQECIDRFDELKVSLGIKDNYDIIYSKDNAPYYTWVANGYFHVFLNVIYNNVMYMAVKVNDVNYYHKIHNQCIIKLKDKTLEFRADAKVVFDKILPNKDYDWLKGYQQR